MYEKTIAKDFKIFSIAANATPTIIYDLLNGTEQDFCDSHVIIDGIITSDEEFIIRSDSNGPGITIPPSTYFNQPVYNWVNKTYIENTGDVVIKIYVA